jgi:patatin-like phospholipase/acyl hydrolase
MAFQILSLSGGGYLGLYTIAVLEKLEEQTERPVASHFDLIAGTSIGGILALALAAEIPAKQIRIAFENNGAKIFSSRAAPKTKFGEFFDFFRSIRSSKYDSGPLRDTITEILGKDTLLGDLRHPVIVPSVNLTKGKPQVFKTDHHPDFRIDHSRSAIDVALATSAAPTYFPIATNR